MAASATSKAHNRDSATPLGPRCHEDALSQSRDIIKPTITELTKEVRTNILCTVEGCGKILPNTPALNMHLVKSHRIKDGIVNPTVRKDLKGSQKLYCCPIEGCPRGPHRPFSQFSLVKQHFMKMHAEKKHKCFKCNNGYSTEWDLKRHIEDCGRTYHCTCGCPYASRAALLSHIYRTGHEIPTEHRIPPVKKRKMEKLLSRPEKVKTIESTFQLSPAGNEPTETALPSDAAAVRVLNSANRNAAAPRRSLPKLLLPKPELALVSVPVMRLAHLPVLLPSADSGALRSVVLAVNRHGAVGTLHLLGAESLCFEGGVPTARSAPGSVSAGVQVSLDLACAGDLGGLVEQRGRSASTNIQTGKSYLGEAGEGAGEGGGEAGESSVSSCSQTDISVGAQVLLPVSVETQTFSSRTKATSSIGAQTDGQRAAQGPCSSSSAPPPHKNRLTDVYEDSKAGGGGGGGMCFGAQTDELSPNGVADHQTQTMSLLSDLENILSDSMSGHPALAAAAPGGSAQEQHGAIDFDFEEFLNAVHIQTQTEESELRALGGDAAAVPLESLDTQTQTDFLLMGELGRGEAPGRGHAHAGSVLELFDTQTQTDLDFLLSAGRRAPLVGGILRHSSFSVSTESSDTETQTDVPLFAAGLSEAAPAGPPSSAETQTASGPAEGLGHLFLTSNETQTVMDDFLSADLAWNMESHFSSVETQTCEELCALFQQPEKPNS